VIVVYYAKNWYSPATRIVFTLAAAGFGDRVRLLEGGMTAWVRDGHAISTRNPAAPVGGSAPRLSMQSLVVDAAFVQASRSKRGSAVVDARAASFYDGTVTARRGTVLRGHIPGALNVPYGALFDGQGALRTTDELRAIFAKAGIKPGDTVIGYCHVGQQATAMLFAAQILGHRILLYDGSMEDWVNRKLPLEAPKSAQQSSRESSR
jgi:thiosulfate/3-mercaptopyruvate sulfurtransferase